MIKWLLVIGVVGAIYYFFIKKSSPIETKERTKNSSRRDEKVDEMVECSRCGVYVDIKEAILSGGKYYCSKECLKG
ncbi:hypothetical protein MNB_SM-7-780 [hydrothermal vent metagenome]|uniref:Prokaryotic metallothionein n=1 Tax=hydrothermal vent metagenome TaxID=652676 RepID=A0A1W1C4G6_9ZZZZ